MQLFTGHPVQFRPETKHRLVGADCPNAARVLLMHTSACMAALAVLLHPSPCQAMSSMDMETVQQRQARRQQLRLPMPTQTMGVREQVAALQELTKEAAASEDAGDFTKVRSPCDSADCSPLMPFAFAHANRALHSAVPVRRACCLSCVLQQACRLYTMPKHC